MSAEMLRLGVHSLIRQLKLSRSRILTVQLDFSVSDNVAELRSLLHGLFGEEKILYSLLGNTMANFEDDTKLLGMFAAELLRPQDRFVLEVATTSRLDDTLAQEAAEEYERSRTFREFVTSALMHYTNLHIDMDSVLFRGSVQESRALRIDIIYQNRTGREIRIALPDRTDVSFPQQDTIRLYLSRKYAQDSLDPLLAESGLEKLHSNHFDFVGGACHGRNFGTDLLILKVSAETARPEQTVAEEIWRRWS
jgi:L-histidine N-alpha-methyltransferase